MSRSAHLSSFLVQVAATVVGILLALGLDQAKEAWRHRRAAEASLALVRQELAWDRDELAKEMKGLREMGPGLQRFAADLEAALAQARAGRRGRKRISLGVQVSFHAASLKSSSWEMALASQSVLHMDPRVAQRCAEAYASHRDFAEAQQAMLRAIPRLTLALERTGGTVRGADQEVRELAEATRALWAQASFVLDIGDGQIKAYQAALEGQP